MKRALCLLLIIFSTQSYAKNEIQTLLEQKSGQTPFEILRQFHAREDGVTIAPTEMNFINFDTNAITIAYNHCATALEDSREPKGDAKLFAFQQTKIIPGTPSNGPLFPGTPDVSITRMSLTTYPELFPGKYSIEMDDILDHAEWNMSQLTTFFGNSSVLSEYGINYYNYAEIRKHGLMISYYMTHRWGGAERDQIYGYCWNE